jgi:hypothetical protein
VAPTSGSEASMFMAQWLLRLPKPECISAQTLRARARACGSLGQRWWSGNFSASVSQMASVSHTEKPSSSTSTGTLPTGLMPSTACLKAEPVSNESKRSITSSNGIPACLSSTQGRMDQDE